MISLMMYSCSAVTLRRGAGATAGGTQIRCFMPGAGTADQCLTLEE
jgi:hypothetical protein